MEELAMKIAKKFIKERVEFFKNTDELIKELVARVKSMLPDAKVFLFGSYVKGEHDVFLSDIDVAIVSPSIRGESMLKRAERVARIRAGIKGGYIFQIHLLTPEEFELYRKFIDVIKRIG